MNDELNGVLLEEEIEFSLADLGRVCCENQEWVLSLVDEGILEPVTGAGISDWRFTGISLQRVRITRHLQRDLGVNLAGAALALDLLEEIESLRARITASGL